MTNNLSGQLPFVSIVMPIRNEADFIERAVTSIVENEYPHDKLEIIIADGMSTDSTRDVVGKLAEADPRIRLIENAGRIVSTGLNEALRQIKGDIFIRIDGHCEIPADFIRKSVETLLSRPEAWVAGGYWKTESDGYVGQVIAAATQSPVGVGGASHRLGNHDGWTDTVPYGAHHKWVLDKIGFFDEELVRNQDDEFNMRINLAGGRIWIASDICSTYYSRSSLKKLWRQYFQYGFWRIRTMQKHGKPATLRQVMPLLFVLSILVLSLAGFAHRFFWWLLACELVLYCLGLGYGSIHVAGQTTLKHSLLAPLVFAILHFGYGVGGMWGIIRFVLLRGKFMKSSRDSRLSR
ncbi:MAG: glycosyltransferase family 2 protein [Planctomycetes bacterium]|nr:glycosyltransferase family 2 protein [Planctomycetota bacterium]